MTNHHFSHEAVRLPAEIAAVLVVGALAAGTLIGAFVLLGKACPGARSGIWHVVTAGCADARLPCRGSACR